MATLEEHLTALEREHAQMKEKIELQTIAKRSRRILRRFMATASVNM